MSTFVGLYSDIENWKSRSKNYHLTQETITIAKEKNTSLMVQDQTYDIDYKEDVQQLWKDLEEGKSMANLPLTKTFLSAHKKDFGLSL